MGARNATRPETKKTHVRKLAWLPPPLQEALVVANITTLGAIKNRYRDYASRKALALMVRQHVPIKDQGDVLVRLSQVVRSPKKRAA